MDMKEGLRSAKQERDLSEREFSKKRETDKLKTDDLKKWEKELQVLKRYRTCESELSRQRTRRHLLKLKYCLNQMDTCADKSEKKEELHKTKSAEFEANTTRVRSLEAEEVRLRRSEEAAVKAAEERKKNIRDLTAESKRAEGLAGRCSEAVSRMEAAATEAEAAVGTLNAQVAEMEEKAGSIGTEIARLRSERTAAEAGALGKHEKQFDEAVLAAHGATLALRRTRDELQLQLNKLEADAANRAEMTRELREKAGSRCAVVAALERRAAEMGSRIQGWEADLETLSARQQRHTSADNDFATERQRLEDELETLTTNLQRSKATEADLDRHRRSERLLSELREYVGSSTARSAAQPTTATATASAAAAAAAGGGEEGDTDATDAAAADAAKAANVGPRGFVHGYFRDLVRCRHRSFEVALGVALGMFANALVVDRYETGKLCVEYLQTRKLERRRFQCLDSMKRRAGGGNEAAQEERLRTLLKDIPGQHKLASDVVAYDAVYADAIHMALRKVVIAQDYPTAARIAYHERLRAEGTRVAVVTLDGIKIDKDGCIIKDATRARRIAAQTCAREVQELEGRVETVRGQLAAVVAKLETANAGPHHHLQHRSNADNQTDILRISEALAVEQAQLAQAKRSEKEKRAEGEETERLLRELEGRDGAADGEATSVREQLQEVEKRIAEAEQVAVEELGKRLRVKNLSNTMHEFKLRRRELEKEEARVAIEAARIETELEWGRGEVSDKVTALEAAREELRGRKEAEATEKRKLAQVSARLEKAKADANTDSAETTTGGGGRTKYAELRSDLERTKAAQTKLKKSLQQLQNQQNELTLESNRLDQELVDVLRTAHRDEDVTIPLQSGTLEDLERLIGGRNLSSQADNPLDIDFSALDSKEQTVSSMDELRRFEEDVFLELRKQEELIGQMNPNFNAEDRCEEARVADKVGGSVGRSVGASVGLCAGFYLPPLAGHCRSLEPRGDRSVVFGVCGVSVCLSGPNA
eukprot:GHVU01088165.1.p1 GENE.GHVU01088165.1~~GHVU01088165.1.p1  ORF type:complete len:996 (-),score=297.04 GHVU01088165.1:159-3146(-)